MGDILRPFEMGLRDYDEVWFYHNPGRFYPLYKKLIRETSVFYEWVELFHVLLCEDCLGDLLYIMSASSIFPFSTVYECNGIGENLQKK